MDRSMNEMLVSDFAGYEDIGGGQSKAWIPLNQRARLSIPHLLGICCAMLSFQIAYTVEFSLGNPIMSRLGVPGWAQTIIWLCGPLSGFLVQPLIGFYSDIATFKMGRRRPFILIGSAGIGLGFVLMYFVEKLGDAMGSSAGAKKSAKIVWFIIALLITNVSINIIQGPSRTLVGDVVPMAQQKSANSMASLMLGVATVITNLLGGLDVATKTGLSKHGIYTEQLTFIAGGVLIVIGVVITMIVAKEEQLRDPPKKQNPFKEIFAAAKAMPKPVLRIGILIMLSWMAYMPFQIELTDFFGVVVFGGDPTNPDDKNYRDGLNFGMLTMANVNGLVMLFSPLQGKLMNCLGMKWLYAISQIVEAAVLIPLFFVTNKWILFGLLAPMGIACQLFNSVPYAVVGMIIPQEQMGVYMGVLNSFVVVGQQISNFAIGTGVGAAVGNKKGYIIGSGAVFAIAAAIFSSCIIVPDQDKNDLDGETSQAKPLLSSESSDMSS